MIDNLPVIPDAAVAEVRKAYEQSQQRFPTIQLAFEDYLRHLESKVAALMTPEWAQHALTTPWLAAFAQLHHQDLFLALACSLDDRIAWEFFADEYLPMLRRFAAFACRETGSADDLAQDIVERLLQDKERLSQYNGRSSLAGWLRIVVSNAAIDRVRRSRRLVSLDDFDDSRRDSALGEAKAGGETVEARMDDRWGLVFCQVLADEIHALSARDRLLLSLYYLQGVPLKIIGAQFKVHEATASRWLDSLRRGIRARVEKELRRRHGLRPSEIQSLWHWVSENDGFSIEQVINR